MIVNLPAPTRIDEDKPNRSGNALYNLHPQLQRIPSQKLFFIFIMEFQFSSFTIILPFLAFIFMVWMIRRKPKHNNSITYLLPPGPRKLPVIGNIHNLVSSLPHRRLGDLAKKYGPIMNLQLGEVNTIVISSPETAKELMTTHDVNFAQRPAILAAQIVTYGCTDIAFSPYGEYWRQLRKMCVLELLSAKRVQSFKSIREEEVTKLVRSMCSCAGTMTNFSRMLYTLTYNITSRVAFGMISSDDEEAFLSIVKKLLQLSSGLNIADLYPSRKLLRVVFGMQSKLEKVHQEFDRIVEIIINEHKARRAGSKPRAKHEEKDIVDVLLDLQQRQDPDSPLTTNNIKAVILDLFIAGTDTSTTTLEWAMSELLRDPTVMEKAQTEVRQVFGTTGNIDEADLHQLHYLKLVIKETLRLHPPLPLLLPRESRSNCEINGYDIPAKSQLMVNAWAIGRDPNYWNEAERFYPERFLDDETNYKGTNFEFIPFGAGRRMCPGMLFGIVNVEIALAYLLYHFNWELPAGVRPENLDMSEIFGSIVKRKNDLLLVPKPYLTQPVN